MRWLRTFSVALVLLAVCGCTHVTQNTSQFYLAQDYLPLPPLARDLQISDDRADGCAGPVQARYRKPDGRYTAQVLPGMTLQVTETSYAATRDDASKPILAEWRWVIPAAGVSGPGKICADQAGAVPLWGRSDLLRVRHLLTGAQVLREAPAEDRPPYYFAEAIAQACANASGKGVDLTCAEGPFLEKFIAGLEFNVRAQAKIEAGDPQSDPQPEGPFEIEVPRNVLAEAGAPPPGERGYGRWYAGLSSFWLPEDLFAKGRQAERCRGPFIDSDLPNENSRPQDAPVCKFAQTSLEWSDMDGAYRMPGKTLETIKRLSLLRSGDPLLLFQPQNYFDPLDLGNSKRCNGDANCLLAARTMQGFANIDLLIPITLEGGERSWVPVGMTISAYENANGVTITRISRSTRWLPQALKFDDGKEHQTSSLAGSRGRLDLGFVDLDKRHGIGGGVNIQDYVASTGDETKGDGRAKADFLFAPGDIVSFLRR